MSTVYFWMIPLFSAFIGSCVALVCRGQLRFQMKAILEFSKHDDDEDIEEKIKQLIAERLAVLIETFKSQIPLASTFISREREEKLRHDACEELYKAVPSISALVDGNPIVIELTDKIWRSITYSLMLMGGLVGALLGPVEMLILMGLTGFMGQ